MNHLLLPSSPLQKFHPNEQNMVTDMREVCHLSNLGFELKLIKHMMPAILKASHLPRMLPIKATKLYEKQQCGCFPEKTPETK